jgi:NAD(P)-dependent dehydrogenase (short-subunit alcohol dehydrogenase family)
MSDKKRHYVVTGGSGLIGSAIVKGLLGQGYSVSIFDIVDCFANQKRNKSLDDKVNFFNCDITSDRQLQTSISSAIRLNGHIDGLVHAAYPRSKQWGTKFGNLEYERLSEDLSMQLGGAILVSQCFLQKFVEQGFGSLVHIASIQGCFAPKFEHYSGTEMVSPIEYAAIKSGIIAITKYLSKLHFGTGVRVNCISPGGILDGQPQTFLDRYRKDCNLKGMLDQDDLVPLVLFLLSPFSSMISGQNVVIDDGWSL